MAPLGASLGCLWGAFGRLWADFGLPLAPFGVPGRPSQARPGPGHASGEESRVSSRRNPTLEQFSGSSGSTGSTGSSGSGGSKRAPDPTFTRAGGQDDVSLHKLPQIRLIVLDLLYFSDCIGIVVLDILGPLELELGRSKCRASSPGSKPRLMID